MRIDQLLVQRGLASTRSQAQRLIADGVQWQLDAPWRRVAKNGDDVPEAALIRLLNDEQARYVSRGGLKLEAALQRVGLDVRGMRCLDVGQSTGGFTDCLLQAGATQVVGVDVGSAQLHPRLRADERVVCVEGVNARTLCLEDLGQAFWDSVTDAQADADTDVHADADADPDGANTPPNTAVFDVVVLDLAFISQTLVLPAVVPMLKRGGTLLSLVKPQFELQPGQVGKGGIVRDSALYTVVEQRLRSACTALGLDVTAWFDSPITGGDGNHEFFIAARHTD